MRPGTRSFLKSRLATLVFILSVATVFLASLYSRSLVGFSMGLMEYNIGQRLKETSLRAAALVTAEELSLYREEGDMGLPGYKALRERLREFAEEADVLFVYYLRVGDGMMRYIVDNDYDPATQVGLDTPPLDEKLTPGAGPALSGQVSTSRLGHYTDGWEGLLSAYAPIFDADGKVVALCGVDINDEQIARARRRMDVLGLLQILSVAVVFASGLCGLAKYRREASLALEASQAKSRFLSSVSHEIRTPMNAIIGLSELALRESAVPPRALGHVKGIREAGQSLLSIINDILDFSGLESGRLSLAPGPYGTADLLVDALGAIQARISEKPIELIADLDPSLPAVLLGDSTRLRQILINILGNAVKFTEKGFIRFSVSWEECPGDCVILSFRVEDSGLGIRGSDLGRLFVDFERLAGQGVEGTGLGLSIAKSLCRAMGGDIAAESVLGKGSVFTATVRQQIEDRYPMGEVWSGAPDRPEIHRPPFLAPAADILVVDDLPSNLLVAEGLLGPYGAMVTACRGGREAVEMASSRPFDLVFMDHMMPDLDGVAATAAIRAIPGCEGLPIVALTANAVAGMKEMFLRNGFSDFLPKPIAIASLAGIMDKWIPAAKRVVPSRPTAQAGPAEDVSLPEIEGLDAKAGLAMAGGSPGRFRRLLGMFCRDAMARLALLGQAGASGRHDGLAVQAHALKGSLASIGAARLAEEAACLEAAALAGDWPPRERLAAFRAALETLARRVEAALAGPGDAEGYAGLAGLLARLGEALACEDLDAIELAMGELGGLALCGPSSDLFLGISELVLRSEFLEAAGVVRKALDCTSLGGGE